jgi:hypothetical protein
MEFPSFAGRRTCGHAVNADQIAAWAESSLAYGLTATL